MLNQKSFAILAETFPEVCSFYNVSPCMMTPKFHVSAQVQQQIQELEMSSTMGGTCFTADLYEPFITYSI